ncbi:MAG: hypothetical protein GXO84_09130 [Chlorobi bacterium]|nr:hypothetical protein [Chlorobiota bacterium]
MTIDEFISKVTEHYPALRIFISGLLGAAPFFTMPTSYRYLSHEFTSETSRILHRVFFSWLIASAFQFMLVYFGYFGLMNVFVIATLSISTIGILLVINCAVVVIAINAYVRPIKFASKAYGELGVVDIEFMKIFLGKTGFIRPLPKELYFSEIIDLYIRQKDLPAFERRLMSKEESRGTPLTASEMKEWEESHEKSNRFDKLYYQAYELACQTRWKAFVLIAIITVVGIFLSYI